MIQRIEIFCKGTTIVLILIGKTYILITQTIAADDLRSTLKLKAISFVYFVGV